ncbi:uncharacterized protein K452DRAFT_316610 [Aplosporella prunicola CBS 121167]|uniref:HIT-type domain-containing protein n=1 Tax=Aplosporella prunicola CBS 121167 TaxID=1176127 RepID=A0A6A6BMM7_9PEZI|nr:uncharacterized protein K452DRAFT_316610 [Aplosporella prunicola CBS 121167]KAF2144663.1 hypothetical protein K452DRAFT_316610 [Aplosporella prunicola CBS 121167]
MPHIELLPHTGPGAIAPAPGWAYVPDTGYDPSKAAINPTARKRTAAHAHTAAAAAAAAAVAAGSGGYSGGGGTDHLSARQQSQLAKRLAELDRDNHKDVALPTGRGSASASSGAGGVTPRERAGKKLTPAVRKILISGRTFAHWLADEEALAAQRQSSGGGASARSPPPPSSSVGSPALSGGGGGIGGTIVVAGGVSSGRVTKRGKASKRGSTAAAAAATTTATTTTTTTTTATATATAAAAAAAAAALASPSSTPNTPDTPAAPPGTSSTTTDNEPEPDTPLLARPAHLPLAPPSAHTLRTQLSLPALPYAAARAQPPATGAGPPPPRRRFCDICGYWGRVACLRCGAARVCGLECKRAHDETACLRFG